MSYKFTIDGHDFDTANIPQSNLDKLVEAAVGHKVRNEAASKARSRLTKDMGDEEAKAFKFDRENPGHVAEYRSAQSEIANTIVSGEIGASRSSGPRMSESGKLAQTYSRDAVLAVLQGRFKLWCKDGKPIKNKLPPMTEVFTFGDGTKREFGEMVASYLAKNKAAVDKRVEKVLAERAREAAKASEGELNF
jgi:hypothetical protein